MTRLQFLVPAHSRRRINAMGWFWPVLGLLLSMAWGGCATPKRDSTANLEDRVTAIEARERAKAATEESRRQSLRQVRKQLKVVFEKLAEIQKKQDDFVWTAASALKNIKDQLSLMEDVLQQNERLITANNAKIGSLEGSRMAKGDRLSKIKKLKQENKSLMRENERWQPMVARLSSDYGSAASAYENSQLTERAAVWDEFQKQFEALLASLEDPE